MLLIVDLAYNPGMCRDRELNQQPFGLQVGAHPLSHTSQGSFFFFNVQILDRERERNGGETQSHKEREVWEGEEEERNIHLLFHPFVFLGCFLYVS